jgi:mycothiol synthase
MSTNIRLASNPADRAAAVALQHVSVGFAPWGLTEIEADIVNLAPEYQARLLLLEEQQADGPQLLALCRLSPSIGRASQVFVELLVHPQHRQRGYARQLWQAAQDHLQQLAATTLSLRVSEDDAIALAFAAKFGFVERKRDFESTLDLLAFDLSPWQAQFEVAGIEFATWQQLDSPSFQQQIYDFWQVVREDVPRGEPLAPISFEFFMQNIYQASDFLHQTSQVALAGGEIVGFSATFRAGIDGWLDQWLTASGRDYRGRGIALALKLRQIETAKALGFTTVRTDNDTRNAAMLAINEKLGFARLPMVISLKSDWPTKN